MRAIPMLLLPCLVAACGAPTGNEAGNAGNAADADTVNAVDAANATMAIDVPANAAGNAAAPVVGNGADAVPSPAASGESVASLPLRRGFYVTSDTPCGNASNATLMLVRRDGYGGSRYSCIFKAIERTGPTSYRVTEECSDGGEAWGAEENVSTERNEWRIQDDTHFTSVSASGDSYSARFCPQARLPEPWNTNDISDIVK